ncbi:MULTISPECIES: dihydrolipoyl dehydrogenase family protein [Pontibacillus]|uniref:FAD-dependent oxidoreductase n=1 Tax=Pontibacillus chungwhensis TaxID=265426 RepID=A0ABY8UUD5_9BACI|nr:MULTISPECIES: FAD-dependent oxidoreductase [Pontibacillus]MCD5323274.1 FAD-dependent oxidoreductase [Pontibacillus sp. HN14]WIF96657.1 FAD-dependent oxidoreductase [Pontibacillus chungwhensis]
MVVGEIAEQRDVVVIGGGPGGYNAAVHAAKQGFHVTIIEKGVLGGVCLNEGCIPSKLFSTSASKLAEVKSFSDFGISTEGTSFNLSHLQSYREKVVGNLRKGVEALCKSNKVEIIEGHASFLSEDRIGVDHGHQFDVYHFNHAIIATGSRPFLPDTIEASDERILTGESLYRIEDVPDHLLVYGSDYIALEAAMTFRQFGAKVSLVIEEEKEDFGYDSSINRELKRVLKKQKIKVYSSASIGKMEVKEERVNAVLLHKGEDVQIDASHAFVSAGVLPNLEELGIDRLGMETEDGFIKTDAQMHTSIKNIYAIGDVTTGPALAVKAIKQAEVVGNTINGVPAEFDSTFIPVVAHTIPPIASVGMTEEQALEAGYQVRVGQFGYGGNGYATIHGKREGFIKLVIQDDTDIVLGFHAFGAGAVELISTGTVALEMAARDEDLSFPHYPHPSYNESIPMVEPEVKSLTEASLK